MNPTDKNFAGLLDKYIKKGKCRIEKKKKKKEKKKEL